jgi:hypothetical protein
MTGDSITGCGDYGLAASGSNVNGVVINNANIYGNSAGGVLNEAASTIDARNCWWGDATGPYNPTSNPSGTGNSVSDNVLFDPWLTRKAR